MLALSSADAWRLPGQALPGVAFRRIQEFHEQTGSSGELHTAIDSPWPHNVFDMS
jgi:hypothetical protein